MNTIIVTKRGAWSPIKNAFHLDFQYKDEWIFFTSGTKGWNTASLKAAKECIVYE